MLNALDAVETLSISYVDLTVTAFIPSSNAIKGVIENIPVVASAVVVIPVVTPSTNKVTVLPSSAVPSIVGVESLVKDVVVVIDG